MLERYGDRVHRGEEVAPRFFRLGNAKDREELEALLRRDARVELYDPFLEQVEELAETRNPSRTLTKPEREQWVREYLAGRDVEVLGAWVYYPWSHRVVHLLDEPEFVELRTNRNHYKITPEEQTALEHKRVGVVGLSVGQSVSLTMAMERTFGELRVADFDRLGLSNLNRIRAGVHSLNLPKVAMTLREIAELDPYLNVRGFPQGLTVETLDTFMLEGGKLDLLIDECDDLTMKLLLRRRARELGIPVLMETSDKGLVDIERFDLEPGRPIFHGLIEDLDPSRLKGLTNEEKVPFVLKIIGEKTVSSRLIASMVEVGQSLKTWPQLASSVVMGGGLSCDVARRMLLGQLSASGRFFVDAEALISDAPQPQRTEEAEKAETKVEAAPAPAAAPMKHADAWRDIVGAATLAPSGGNCQPWRFFAEGPGTLWLQHDRPRSASFLDFEDTAAMLALGAALENAVLAAHQRNQGVKVELFPANAPLPLAVARLTRTGDAAQSAESRTFDGLYPAVAQRCSNRKLGKRAPLPGTIRAALLDAAHSIPGATLQLLETPEDLQEAGAILGSGDRVRFLNKQLHQEMMSEIRWTPEETAATRDGIDIETLEMTPSDRAGVTLCRSWPAMQLVRRVGGGFALEKMSKKAVAASSAVGLLTMPSATHRDFVLGGRALQRVWLTATLQGLAFQPMSSLPYLFARLVRGRGEGLPPQQAQELAGLRARYERLFNVSEKTGEVLLFRLAFADEVQLRALRRPVEAVLSALP